MKSSLFLIFMLLSLTAASQQAENTPGLYYKTGGNGQDQWYQILATGNGLYAVTDIYGQGATTDFTTGQYVINPNGNISFNGGTLNRVIDTDQTFPLTLSQPFTPNALFADDWAISERDINPVTGQAEQLFDGTYEFVDVFTLSIHDNSVRFTDSLGTYFQGASDGNDTVIFRRLLNPAVNLPTTGPYATIPGSTHNFPRDILGKATFTDINHFEVLLAIQDYTVTPLNQFYLNIAGQRVNPLPPGDVNGDREVNAADRSLMIAQIGKTKQMDGFNIAADLNGDETIDYRDIKVFDGEPLNTQTVTAAMTGQWYDRSHSGEGWDLQILDANRANLSWYTYDASGKQLWLVGVGEISGHEIYFPQMAIASTGTSFGPDFDPDEVVLADWGWVRFYFETCNLAGMSYNSTMGLGHGGMNPIRLTQHAGLDCENNTINTDEINPFTGLWYDPSHSGEGWAIQVRPDNQASISWFTYDQEGKPMWMVGIGEITGSTLTVEQLVITRGGIFGPDFDPDTVVRELWGRLEFTRTGCHQGTLTYEAVDPVFNSGTLNPVRLASMTELHCED